MNGKTYTNGLGIVVEVEVVVASASKMGAGATVDVGAAEVDGATWTPCVAASCGAPCGERTEHDQRQRSRPPCVHRRSTVCPMRHFGGLGSVSHARPRDAGRGVQHQRRLDHSRHPGTSGHAQQHGATIDGDTVAESVVAAPTSTIVLPGGACVFSAAPPAPEVTFEVGNAPVRDRPGQTAPRAASRS